jgi:hypothetical protein
MQASLSPVQTAPAERAMQALKLSNIDSEFVEPLLTRRGDAVLPALLHKQCLIEEGLANSHAQPACQMVVAFAREVEAVHHFSVAARRSGSRWRERTQ